MNKELFQQIFGRIHGYVYLFNGTVPPEENAAHYITELFSQAAGTNLLNTMVIELSNFGATVIYVDSTDSLVNSTEFQLLTDLIPVKIIEPTPTIDPIAPTEG